MLAVSLIAMLAMIGMELAPADPFRVMTIGMALIVVTTLLFLRTIWHKPS